MCQAHMSKPEDDFVECILSFTFTWATEIKLKLLGLCGQPFTYGAMSQPCFLLCIQSETLTHGMVLLTFEMDLPFSVKPLSNTL